MHARMQTALAVLTHNYRLSLDPGNLKALLRRASAHRGLGFRQDALADLNAVIARWAVAVAWAFHPTPQRR